AGFTGMTQSAAMPTAPGRYYLVAGGTLIAWSTEHEPDPVAGMRVVGAHTDSPTLRIKPQPDISRAGFQQLGVEVYGGPLLNSWLDRDLGLAGRVSVRAGSLPQSLLDGTDSTVSLTATDDPAGVATVLVSIPDPIL